MLRVLICMVVPKGKCGGAFYFVVFIQRKKEKSERKRRNKVPQEKKKKKVEKKKRNATKIELFSCIVLISIKGWRKIRKLFRV